MNGVIKIVDPNPAAVVVPEHTGFGGLDFQLDASEYQMYFFEGAFGEVVVDPTESGNTVVKFIRTAESKHYAGVILGYLDGFKVDEIPVDLEAGNTTIKARIWSPNDGIVAGMQITDSVETGKGNNYFNVFTQVTLSKGWNDAVFDFQNQSIDTSMNLVSFFPTGLLRPLSSQQPPTIGCHFI